MKMPSDENEVLGLEQKFIKAWNEGDARGAASVYADDGIRVGAFGDFSRGRKELESAYDKLLHGPMSGAKVSFEPSVRLLAPNVAIVKGPMTITTSEGKQLKGYALDIWKKLGGKWQVVEAHPKLFESPK